MASYVPPRDPYELQACVAAAAALGRGDVGAFDELALSPAQASNVSDRLFACVGRRLSTDEILSARTVADVASACRMSPKAGPWRSLVTIRATNAGPAFAFVHPIGGNAFWYLDLCRKLGDDVAVHLLHARGLDLDETPHRAIAQMAAAYAEELRDAPSAGPWVLCGWSFGGLVAYETARRLATDGATAPLVALFDVGPQNQRVVPASREAAWGLLIHALRLDRFAVRLMALPEPARLARALALATRGRALPADVAVTHVERMLELNLVHLAAAERYEPGSWDGDMLLFAATDGMGVAVAPGNLGWEALVRGELHVHPLAGTHFDLLSRSNHGEIAARLRAETAALRPETTSSISPAAPRPPG